MMQDFAWQSNRGDFTVDGDIDIPTYHIAAQSHSNKTTSICPGYCTRQASRAAANANLSSTVVFQVELSAEETLHAFQLLNIIKTGSARQSLPFASFNGLIQEQGGHDAMIVLLFAGYWVLGVPSSVANHIAQHNHHHP
jgi:hypothetical protein